MASGLGNYPSLVGVSNSITNNTVNTNISFQGQAAYETNVNIVPNVLSITNQVFTLPNRHITTSPSLQIGTSTVLPNLTVGGIYSISFSFFFTYTSTYSAGDFAIIGVFSPISGSAGFNPIGQPYQFVPVPLTIANNVVPGGTGMGTYSTIFTAQNLSGQINTNYIIGGYWYTTTINGGTNITGTIVTNTLTIQKIG